MNKILHKRSSVVTDGNPKLPSSEMLDYGELAINYADGAEVITLKNTSNEIVEFRSKNYFEDIINNNELVVSKALNELTEKVDNIEGEYYTKQEIDNKGYLTEHQDISGKQDVISDLATIRDNAAKGATALQEVPEEYVTETELEGKGYLTSHQDISHLVEKTYVDEKITETVQYCDSKVFIGTQEEYDIACTEGKVAVGALVIILDENEANSDATTAMLGKAIIGTLLLGRA